jgi:CheY-like chemotaxis protein
VVGDEKRLRQVLLNLLSNAVKFTPFGRVALNVDFREGNVHFEVLDSGPGMTEQELEGLFQAFQQTASGRKAKEGTGLGLHISQAMVRLMGSEITVESKVGVGSAFRFAIHLDPASVDVPEPQESCVVEGIADGQARLKMLVADDRVDNRDLLSEILRRLGFDVIEAENGVEALEAWESEQPDVTWMDIRMPLMNGMEAVKVIRAREETSNQPRRLVFALTASALDVGRKPMLDMGFNEVIYKPFYQQNLVDALEKHGGVMFRKRTVESTSSPANLDIERLLRQPASWIDEFRRVLQLGDATEALRLVGELDDEVLFRTLSTKIKAYRFDELLHQLPAREDRSL